MHTSESYTLRLDFAADRLELADPRGQPLLVAAPLVGVSMLPQGTHDLKRVKHLSSQDMALVPSPDDPLAARFVRPEVEVTLRLDPQPERVLFCAEVFCKQGTVLALAVPHTFALVGRPRNGFLWPEVLGCEFTERFLASQGRAMVHYPPAFCDFAAAELGDTPAYFYRCQPEERPRPSALILRGGEPPIFRRYFRIYLAAGERWAAPALACQVGGELRPTLLRYKAECRLGRPLARKLPRALWEKWSRAARVTVFPPLDEALEVVRALSQPAIVDPFGWMFGGFDRKYPDFLPPNEAYGGERGFRQLIELAHARGHLVQPYVNFTWWCAGWEGEGSAPAPSYEKFGDAPLARDIGGGLFFENYSGNFGYAVCPAHPVAKQRRLAVRDALLDDYGVDLLYEDQLGARRWLIDLNPALENPADYGWALLRIGEEDAARCPVETEFGNDRVLSFACALNYWALDPLSTVNDIPGRPTARWTSEQRRSFPFALFLSTGDAVVNIPRCTDPARLAWALLLGGRVDLGPLRASVRVAPDGEVVRFLQGLAEELGEHALGDRLLRFQYLAPRVARAEYAKHEVLANFSDEPWPLAGGGQVAPGGFDLRSADGFRAGAYLIEKHEPAYILFHRSGARALALARRSFSLRLGDVRLRATVPRPPRRLFGGRVLLADFGEQLGAIFNGKIGARELAAAFAPLQPNVVRTPAELWQELPAARVLVNSHSEYLPTEQLDRWPEAAARLRQWCEGGGILVEIAGWPLWIAAAPRDGGWERRRIGPAGLRVLCAQRCAVVGAEDKLESIALTPLGRAALSPETAAQLKRTPAAVIRPPEGEENTLVLARGEAGPYLVIHRIGYGALLRVAGVPNAAVPRALAEVVHAILERRLDLGPPFWPTPLCVQAHAEPLR